MKKLITATVIALTLSTPAMASNIKNVGMAGGTIAACGWEPNEKALATFEFAGSIDEGEMMKGAMEVAIMVADFTDYEKRAWCAMMRPEYKMFIKN